MLEKSTLLSFLKKYGNIVLKENSRVINIIEKTNPNDDFSISMWSLDQTIFRNKLELLTKNSDKVLDFGCGSGNWSISIASKVSTVKAIDISEARINTLREILLDNEINNVTTELINTEKHELGQEIYNVVICYNVFPYMNDYDDKIQKFYNSLKPGGLLFCSSADIGIIFFYLWSARKELSLKVIFNLFSTFFKAKMKSVYNRNTNMTGYNGIYLRRKKILSLANTYGFKIRNDLVAKEASIYPRKIMYLPCFNEFVFQKPMQNVNSQN